MATIGFLLILSVFVVNAVIRHSKTPWWRDTGRVAGAVVAFLFPSKETPDPSRSAHGEPEAPVRPRSRHRLAEKPSVPLAAPAAGPESRGPGRLPAQPGPGVRHALPDSEAMTEVIGRVPARGERFGHSR